MAKPGAMSAEDMIALMNNPTLLMQSSTGGAVMQTGANRDADGTIDRSPPPTPEVVVILKELKRCIDRYGIDMTSEFRTQGATQYGTVRGRPSAPLERANCGTLHPSCPLSITRPCGHSLPRTFASAAPRVFF